VNNKTILAILLTILLGVSAAILLHRHFKPQDDHGEIAADASLIPHPLQVHTTLPNFTLTDLEGKPQSPGQWAGKVLVFNFWATWCPPCRQEIPGFIALQHELGAKGLQFVGIAIDDPEAVRRFATETQFNYPILVGDSVALKLSQQLGNRLQGLPFSVIFDREGQVVYSTVGGLTPETLREKAGPLL